MEIFIVRHGLSEGNEQQIFQGRIDFPLAEEGRRQAEFLGNYFEQQRLKFDRIVSSPLKRASQTAELIVSKLDNPPAIEFENAFIEFDIGKLEGVKSSEVKELFPTYYTRPPEGWMDFSEYGGESMQDLQQRVDRVLDKYAPEDKLLETSKLLIVTHGGTMRGIVRNLVGIDSKLMFFRVENCCHFKVNFYTIRGQLRRYLEYFLPLSALLVAGKNYEYGIDEEKRTKLVS